MRATAKVLLLLFVFVTPWQYSLDLGAPFGNIARVLGMLLLMVALPAVGIDGHIRSLKAMHWVTAAFYAWLCCTYFWTVSPVDSLQKLRGYPQEIMVAWLVWEFADSAEDFRGLIRAWLLGSWVLAILTIAAFLRMKGTDVDQIRFFATGQDPNDAARALGLGFPIAAVLLSLERSLLDKVISALYFPVAFGAVLLTASRSGFMVALIALAGCGVLWMRRNFLAVLAGIVGLTAVAWLTWAYAPLGTYERLWSILDQIGHGDLNERLNIWSAGWRAFAGSPILGSGIGSFVAAAGLATGDTAHNTPLALLVEGGVCALALGVAIFVTTLRSLFEIRGPLRMGLLTLVAAWSVASVVGTLAESRITWVIVGIVATGARIATEGAGQRANELTNCGTDTGLAISEFLY